MKITEIRAVNVDLPRPLTQDQSPPSLVEQNDAGCHAHQQISR